MSASGRKGVTVTVPGGFSRLMLGSEGFWAFIEGNVDPSRIVTKVNRRGGTHEGR